MSDAFAGINYGDAAQNILAHGRERFEEVEKKEKKIRTTGTIEQALGSAKILITGKKISEETVKALKPYAKQQLEKGITSAKKGASEFVEKWAGKGNEAIEKSDGVLTKFTNPTFNPTGNFGELQPGDITFPTSTLPTDGSMIANPYNPMPKPRNIPEGDEEAGDLDPIAEETEDVTEDVIEPAETSTISEEASTLGGVSDRVAAARSTIQDTLGAAKKTFSSLNRGVKTLTDSVKSSAEKVTGDEVAADVGGEAAAITGGEAAGAVLDAIPGLNVLGLLIGIGTAAAGAAEMKHKVKMTPMPLGQLSGSSFQVGVN